jgi:hypothetical protein
MSPREFTEFAINVRGKPIDLELRPWLHAIYDQPFAVQPNGRFRRKILLVFGRQSEKSTTIGNMFLSMANIVGHLRLLYVSASDVQMREFSDERLRSPTNDSPRLSRLARGLDGKSETQNVQTKRWKNQSKIILRSVYRSADRVRGISADVLGCDELQDIYTDTLPIIGETQFASDLEGGPITMYAGTPKTFENALEYHWSRLSTQNEWAIKCRGCRHWNVIEIENIGPTGLICTKCSGPLDPLKDGRWVRFGKEDAVWEGYRVPQPVVLYAHKHKPAVFEAKWDDLLTKRDHISRSKFLNESMARSYDSGTKPVSYTEVRRCSLDGRKMVLPDDVTRHIQSTNTWAGIDWGTGDGSYTVLSIWYYDAEGRFSLLYAKRYQGFEADPDYSIGDIIQTLRRYHVTRIGVDWGFGFHANPQITRVFGANKVMAYQHSGRQKAFVSWDKVGMHHTTHRTRALGTIFTLIKRGPVSGGIAFPSWDQMEDFAADILSVYQEHNERAGELVYDHPVGVPDDFLHTAVYAFLVSLFDVRRQDVIAAAPGQKVFGT